MLQPDFRDPPRRRTFILLLGLLMTGCGGKIAALIRETPQTLKYQPFDYVQPFKAPPLTEEAINKMLAAGKEAPIGLVDGFAGEALLVRENGSAANVTLGLTLHEGDRILGEVGSIIHIRMVDETDVTLRRKSEVLFKDYRYAPQYSTSAQNHALFVVKEGWFHIKAGRLAGFSSLKNPTPLKIGLSLATIEKIHNTGDHIIAYSWENGFNHVSFFPRKPNQKEAPLLTHLRKPRLQVPLSPYRYVNVTDNHISQGGVPGTNELATLAHDISVLQKRPLIESATVMNVAFSRMGYYLRFYDQNLVFKPPNRNSNPYREAGVVEENAALPIPAAPPAPQGDGLSIPPPSAAPPPAGASATLPMPSSPTP